MIGKLNVRAIQLVLYFLEAVFHRLFLDALRHGQKCGLLRFYSREGCLSFRVKALNIGPDFPHQSVVFCSFKATDCPCKIREAFQISEHFFARFRRAVPLIEIIERDQRQNNTGWLRNWWIQDIDVSDRNFFGPIYFNFTDCGDLLVPSITLTWVLFLCR